MSFFTLRTQFPHFVFRSYEWQLNGESPDQDLIITFHFEINQHLFAPTLTLHHIPAETAIWLTTSEAASYFLHLGMIEAISYWKATCSPHFEIAAGYLSPEQLAWWHDLYLDGLGEFFYRNDIDPTHPNLLTFTCTAAHVDQPIHLATLPGLTDTSAGDVLSAAVANTTLDSNEFEQATDRPRTRFLVGVGGGKDSAVTLGLLDTLNAKQNNRFTYGTILLAPLSPAAEPITEQSGAVSTIRLSRQLDPLLLKLNQDGYLNGHTPFSAYFAFASALAARVYGFDQVVVSNENSANEGNMTWHGRTINHQYSKTFAFETSFRMYMQTWFGQFPVQPSYFSILRPLNELQIAKQFSHYPAFWPLFRSCNVGQKTNTWCHKCPKCVFVYTLLACFLEADVLVGQIFEHDLFTDKELLPIFHQLVGYEANKPFECVGTQAEVVSALAEIIALYRQKGAILPPILASLQLQIGNALASAIPLQSYLEAWDTHHHLSSDLEFALKEQLKLPS